MPDSKASNVDTLRREMGRKFQTVGPEKERVFVEILDEWRVAVI